jgi:hypothetical protein
LSENVFKKNRIFKAMHFLKKASHSQKKKSTRLLPHCHNGQFALELGKSKVNKNIQVEQESREYTKVFHVFNKIFPSISCFWSCISWYFLVFPEIYWYFLIFQGISWYFLVFPNENVCISWCLTRVKHEKKKL